MAVKSNIDANRVDSANKKEAVHYLFLSVCLLLYNY